MATENELILEELKNVNANLERLNKNILNLLTLTATVNSDSVNQADIGELIDDARKIREEYFENC